MWIVIYQYGAEGLCFTELSEYETEQEAQEGVELLVRELNDCKIMLIQSVDKLSDISGNTKYASCTGCGRVMKGVRDISKHKMCPAYNTPFYKSRYVYTEERQAMIERLKQRGIKDADIIYYNILNVEKEPERPLI